jgi:hypothetical protein
MSGHVAAMASRQACLDMVGDCRCQPAGRSMPACHSARHPRSFTATTKAFSVVFPGLSTVIIYVFFLVNIPDYPGEQAPFRDSCPWYACLTRDFDGRQLLAVATDRQQSRKLTEVI